MTASPKIAAGVVDQTGFDEIESVLPFVRNGIDSDLLIVELACFSILDVVRLTGQQHVPIFHGNVADGEPLRCFHSGVMRGDNLTEQCVRFAVVLLGFLNAVNQIGQIAFAVDSPNIIEIPVVGKHATTEDLNVVHFHSDRGRQLRKSIVVFIARRNLELERTSFAHLQRKLGTKQRKRVVHRLINGLAIGVDVEHLQPTSSILNGNGSLTIKDQRIIAAVQHDVGIGIRSL